MVINASQYVNGANGVNGVNGINHNTSYWRTGGSSFAQGVFNRPGTQFGRNNSPSTPDFREEASTIRRRADEMREVLGEMRGRNATTLFSTMQAVSANTDRLLIESTSTLASVRPQNFSVEVTQLATEQRNEGVAMQSDESAWDVGFLEGENQIVIESGGRSFNITFDVAENATARQAQESMAAAINAQTGMTGVAASVSVNQAENTSTITLQTTETGTETQDGVNFTVRDSGGGIAAAITGVDETTQNAQNAVYRVHRGNVTGFERTSASNEVDLGQGVTGTLRETGTTAVTFAASNTSAQVDAMRDAVSAFNNLMTAARATGGRLEESLHTVAITSESALARVGITINQNGSLAINEERMTAAAESGALERFVSDGANGVGFLGRLENISRSVQQNPLAYTQNRDNFQNNFQWNAQIHSAMNLGMLFDTFM